jgi:hypothetical protein
MPRHPDNRTGPDTTPTPPQQVPTPISTTTESLARKANGSPLRRLLEDTAATEGLSLKDLTVLSPQVDPFRLDTPANHRDGKWLADAVATLGLLDGDRMIHERGMHYAIALAATPFIKPDGSRYQNDIPNWEWVGDALKAARWLGYIPFDRVFDKRNAAPVVRLVERSNPWPYLHVGVEVEIPDATDIEPVVGLYGFNAVQPYKLVLIGEKASLDEGLSPIAERYGADLYLPTGNISDALVHQIAKTGADDGRPMVVIYFADCDPSGWNMPIEVGWKLAAFKASLYPDLEFRQYRALLTPDQVREHDLPTGPLKINPKTGTYADRRADAWIEAMGVEQTEVDVLTLPAMLPLLREIATAAIEPFFDATLVSRVYRARRAWMDEAQAVVDATVDQEHLDRLRIEAAAKLATLRAEIDAINEAARVDASDFDLPEVPAVPEAIRRDDQPMGLLDSTWPFAEQIRRLRESKAYRPQGGEA